MTRHIFHLSMIARIQPSHQMNFSLFQPGVGNADLLKTQRLAPAFDIGGKLGEIG